MVISCDVTTAYCLKIKWNNFVRRSHEKWLITDWHHTRNSDNQTTTDIQLTLTDFMKGPFIWCYDCMLPHNQMKYLWSSIAWKLIYYWRTSCQNSDNQTATFVQLNLMHYGGFFFSFDVMTACCLNIKWNNFGRRSRESDFLPKGIISVFRQSKNDLH